MVIFVYVSLYAQLCDPRGGVFRSCPSFIPAAEPGCADASRHVTPLCGRLSSLLAVRLYGRRKFAVRERDGGESVKMAAAVRQDLAQLMNSSGSHKDLAGK